MDYQSRIDLGHIIQAVSSFLAVLVACVFAYVVLLTDVESSKQDIKDNTKAIAQEAELREKADEKLKKEMLERTQTIKDEIKASEERQRRYFEDIKGDLQYLRQRVDENG